MTRGLRAVWQKHLAVWRTRLYRYPPPEPLPRTRSYWLALCLVTVLTSIFAIYFIYFLIAKQDAFLTNAEDLGIMDQALWNTLHGHLLQQTICNVVSDTNCAGFQGLSRFALHFEPILLPLSLLYLIWPDPKTLLVVQTLVVASGAFPAFWLARLRLRNEWAGVAIALLYLLYPAQQNALIFDFHAVTFTSALLLFTLYFMYTRRTALLFIFALLSMACKEEIPLLVACFGLWSLLFQHRWRSGLSLVVLTLSWIGLSLYIFHLYSPTGNALLLSRYTYLGNNPFQILSTILRHPVSLFNKHIWEPEHLAYLTSLLAPSGYLPLLAPWVLILALPTLLLNLFSTDPGMYSGLFQYNAEIVPVLIFATIEAMVVILWMGRWCYCLVRIQSFHAQFPHPQDTREGYPYHGRRGSRDAFVHGTGTPRGYPGAGRYGRIGILALLIYILFSVISQDVAHSEMPFAEHFHWPLPTAHTELAQHFMAMIPATASVSAQTRFVPHLSQRGSIYLFPYGDDRAQYILLDSTSDSYPYMSLQAYNREVQRVLRSGQYGIVAAENGYLLLERGLPPPETFPYTIPT